MEAAPSEATKTNVLGCLNVCKAALDSGAERFVLISTDKAVHPVSVLGVAKHVAELVVRSFAHQAPGRFTAVRFGNVLGTAGSVVPLFKAQIGAGGPVTVTHPEVRRYLMTLHEAVGLVLLAGLRSPGDLSILEMGEPIKILDLARLMITMAGRVPDEEIPIVFTGLRPGEKLEEELMTDEERAASEAFDLGIRVIRSSPPPADLLERVAALAELVDTGDSGRLITAFEELVPSYRPACVSSPPSGAVQAPARPDSAQARPVPERSAPRLRNTSYLPGRP
jgi:FlaA1/EpsC-like NDP-sugar epimerase